MEKNYTYEIRVEGYLTDRWSEWFDGLAIEHEPDGVTVLRGEIPDQAALVGLLVKLQGLNLTILSLNRRAAA